MESSKWDSQNPIVQKFSPCNMICKKTSVIDYKYRPITSSSSGHFELQLSDTPCYIVFIFMGKKMAKRTNIMPGVKLIGGVCWIMRAVMI